MLGEKLSIGDLGALPFAARLFAYGRAGASFRFRRGEWEGADAFGLGRAASCGGVEEDSRDRVRGSEGVGRGACCEAFVQGEFRLRSEEARADERAQATFDEPYVVEFTRKRIEAARAAAK